MKARLPGMRSAGVATTVAIILAAAVLGMAVAWRAPGLSRYAHDVLVRTRGTLTAPDDIAIIAIDEASLVRYGRFPWARSVMARAIERVAAAQPKVIALDVLYTDPTTQDEDEALGRAIGAAGNVIVAAQLTDATVSGGLVRWLAPLPYIARAAAGVGHVNVQTEAEGVAHELMVRLADDSGEIVPAIALEVVRVADRIPDDAVRYNREAVLMGERRIPVRTTTPAAALGGDKDGVEVLPASRMAIDFAGPAGSFAKTTYSIADVVDGRVPPERLRGRYVLIGATAAAMGDRVASPFVHYGDPQSQQHGSFMPGVEVMANAVNTILRSRFYTEMPDWMAFLLSAAVAAGTLVALRAVRGWRQAATLAAAGVAVLLLSYAMFRFWMVIPPVAAAMVSFASAGVLGMVRRSVLASAQMDASIDALKRVPEMLVPRPEGANVAEAIVRVLDAQAAAVLARMTEKGYQAESAFGLPLSRQAREGIAAEAFSGASVTRFFDVPADGSGRFGVIVREVSEDGYLVVAHRMEQQPPTEAIRVAEALASSHLRRAEETRHAGGAGRWWPDTAERKALALADLNQQFVEQSRFVEQALRSAEDGLILASADGSISFANRKAAEIFGSTEAAMRGSNLFDRLARVSETALGYRATLSRLLVDGAPVEREITVGGVGARRYMLRMSAVSTDGAAVAGITATLSDVTRQYELQRTKNDVISLVSHEMRTPLTAIQGMTELLASYDVDPERRKKLNLAINEEAKRLTHMITQYLDITRLEAGATVLRKSLIRVESVVERTMLMLEAVAAQRNIRVVRRNGAVLPPVMADPDLLARALENLTSNAIKYGPEGAEVVVAIRPEEGQVAIEVTDHGYGIPEADLPHIFDKFYRVPRVEDQDAPGTGLGLSLVREIAQLHGGSVSVRSEVNEGSTFTLRIPALGAKEM